METRQKAKIKDRQEVDEAMNSGPSREDGGGIEMLSLLSNSLGEMKNQVDLGIRRKVRLNKESNPNINPYELTGGWTHPDAWVEGNSAIEASPLAPLLKNTKKVGFPEDPFPDIPMDPKAPYRIKEGEKADFHRLTYLYKQEISAQCLVAFYDKCEEKRVVDRFTTVSTNYPKARGDLPPLWLIEMGERIWGDAARKWQGLVAAYLRAEALETRWDIIDMKNEFKIRYPENYREICHEAYRRALEVEDKFASRTPPEEKYFLISNHMPLIKYMKGKSKLVLTEKEKEMIHICMGKEVSTGLRENKSDPPPGTRELMVNREEESEDFHLPTPPEMSSAESSTEECIQTPERGETPVTGPWRVAEEAPPPPEDVNNLTWEHFPVIEDSPEEPQTPEEEVQEPSILSIGPHEITYKRKTTQDAEDTDTHSPLMKEVNACQHLIERVIGAIERMENIVARQDEQLTARSQGGQQLPQQSGTSQPHRSSWQGFQDHASQERRRKKRKPRKKQRKQQTQEDIRVQENAPQQREATSQPQRRRFRTQETTVEQRQDQRRNTWNPPQHHPQRNARVNRGRGTQQTPPQDFQRRPYPHQGFRRREWYPSHQRNTYRWQGQRNPHKERRHNMGNRYNGWADHQRGNSQWGTGRREGRQWQEEDPNNWAWNWW